MSIRKTREQDLVNLCLQWLRLHRCMVWRQNQGGMTISGPGKSRFMRFCHQDGISDIIGLLPTGRFLAVECKQPGKKPTDNQDEFLREVVATRGVAICVTSLQDLQTKLEAELSKPSISKEDTQ